MMAGAGPGAVWTSSGVWNDAKHTINEIDLAGPQVTASSLGHKAFKGVSEKIHVFECKIK
jgi:hypothetical protein